MALSTVHMLLAVQMKQGLQVQHKNDINHFDETLRISCPQEDLINKSVTGMLKQRI